VAEPFLPSLDPNPMNHFDPAGPEVLDTDECLRLMASVPIGRLVFSEGGLPAVHPVSFALDGDSVVFCTAGGRKREAAERGDVVGFQVDEFDTGRHLGWSVTAVGHSVLITDPEELARVRRLPLRPWASSSEPSYVRVWIEAVRGRRIVPQAAMSDEP
jgi:uncharacterized protein